jgi:hypothetical protein
LHAFGNNFSRISAPMVEFGGFCFRSASAAMLMAQCCPGGIPIGLFNADRRPASQAGAPNQSAALTQPAARANAPAEFAISLGAGF